MLLNFQKEIRSKSDPEKAKKSAQFFKTGPGEYGEGDFFLGISVPEIRKLIKKYRPLKRKEIIILLHSQFHQERFAALLFMIERPEEFYSLYLKKTKYINSWDLVDISAYKILGSYLYDKPRDPLYKLARSKNIWERRMAIIATYYFIKQGEFEDTLKISEILLDDEHHLIHKAVGWMLREVGKRDLKKEEQFLKKQAKKMPRITLNYAIEKFPERKRKQYLKSC